MNTSIPLPPDLAEAFRNRQIVLFLGAGTSYGDATHPGLPGAQRLAVALASHHLGRQPHPTESLMQVAQEVVWATAGSRQPLHSRIREHFGSPTTGPLPAHGSLARLRLPMVTTNYDQLIEQAFRLNNVPLTVVIHDKDLTVCGQHILIKIHGCVSQLDTCIITEDDYYLWMANDSDVKALVRAWFLMYQVVFVGYSLRDPNFRSLLVELRRKLGTSLRSSYIVTPEVPTTSYDYRYAELTLGARFIQATASEFLQSLCALQPPSYATYSDSSLRQQYFAANAATQSFLSFAATRILDMIFENRANPLDLDADIRREVFKLARERAGELYPAHSTVSRPCGMVFVPPGDYIMGGSRMGNERIRIERLERGFFIDECPVSVAEYMAFAHWVRESGDHSNCHPDEPPGKNHLPGPEPDALPPVDVVAHALPHDYFSSSVYADFPIVLVDWWDAFAFASWARKRLPFEREWEKAARGIDGRVFPYGDEFDPSRCNVAESGLYCPTRNRTYPNGVSPYGCHDMCGNVWEWCADAFEYASALKVATRVVRGGSCTRGRVKSCCAFRNGRYAHERWQSRGFRCARDLDEGVAE